jgi:two-component system, NtrC family, sensor kinase
MIIVFASFLACVCLLTFIDWWGVASVRQKLIVSEHFEDLFNNILEARRYEKNFFFYHDADSLKENVNYINKVVAISSQLEEDIIRVVGKEAYDSFQHKLIAYKNTMEVYLSQGVENVTEDHAAKVRTEGKAIGDFTERLLELKRERIHRALAITLSLPFAFLAVFVILSFFVAHILFRRMLTPLALIRQTIGKVADGDLSPIPYEASGKDEISQLIHAFNRMAGELEAKQEQLVQSRKIAAIGTFTAGIAHELNNPINNIYLTAETLLEDYENLSKPEGKELVLDVLNQAERAGEIIKNLLDFSRSERPSFEELNVVKVIENMLKLVKNQTMLAGIRVELNIPDGLPSIRGNLRNLEQVFLNLFINAIQAMPGGGRIRVSAFEEPDDFIRIDVRDSGKGIKPEHLEHIFEPFYTTKEVGRGTGLGLAVTYALVKKHGGYIEVQSEVGQGTTFSIYLPSENARAEKP